MADGLFWVGAEGWGGVREAGRSCMAGRYTISFSLQLMFWMVGVILNKGTLFKGGTGAFGVGRSLSITARKYRSNFFWG